jgi:hypothetical protein
LFTELRYITKMEDSKKLTHYQKYKKTIDKNVKKYLENPENRKKHYALLVARNKQKNEEYKDMKKKLEDLKNLIN